ncbi:hypothetical protein CAPTEDRAFT_209705 [Capitella teleta]|uniref:AGC-kinase C-terminal domain-containing protein n=1 Tax=Capitella teleta TaxID=283909 RepID=R7TJH9_CAPTE|nr:hypothetical protein CAPTEDRAFT_213375 [Capitella teleta]ELU14188.1 hypothetical protein CAPTEDRAFT_209705 [Capitella teleta]|eukprot:ELT91260.1 hypothetical protein CAPTEDRAFT_213375 [Capitella teleta]
MWFALFLCLVPINAWEPVILKNQGLLQVPTDVNGSATSLSLLENNISVVHNDAFGYLPKLKHLYFGENNLSIIEDHAFRGTVLNYLSLAKNKLKWFPNLNDIGTTLSVLYMNGNGLRFIRAEQIEALIQLKELHIGSSKIYILTDLSVLPALNYVALYAMSIPCCNKLITLKSDLFPNATYLGTKPSPCNYPEELKGVDWWNITRNDIDIPCPATVTSSRLTTEHLMLRDTRTNNEVKDESNFEGCVY